VCAPSPGAEAGRATERQAGSNRLAYKTPPAYIGYAPHEPIICDKKVSHWGCPVAIVGAETVEQAKAAVEKVKVEYEVLPTYKTPGESLAEGAIPGRPLRFAFFKS